MIKAESQLVKYMNYYHLQKKFREGDVCPREGVDNIKCIME